MAPLKNARHEKFALALAEGKSATEAYTFAGYKPCRKNAARLTTKDDIKARLAEIQAAAAKATEVTVESLLQELEGARKRADSLDQLNAAIRTIEAKAKVLGIMVQRIEERIEVGGPGAFRQCGPDEDVRQWMVDAWVDQLPGRYVIEDDEREELGAFVLQRMNEITDAFDKYRVDVIRNNSPDDMRARELRARVQERQRKLLPPSSAAE